MTSFCLILNLINNFFSVIAVSGDFRISKNNSIYLIIGINDPPFLITTTFASLPFIFNANSNAS